MIDQKLVKMGQSGNIIREIAEYGAEQAKIVGADHVYNFTIGSPSIDPPDCVFETMDRLRASVPASQLYTYAPAIGLPEVREKAAAYLRTNFGIPYRMKDIIITCGTSTCLAVLTRVFLSCGGRAMTFTPYFMDYKYYADTYGSGLTECPTDPNTFQLDLDAAEKALTSDTMLLIMNSPNNPSGVVIKTEAVEKLAKLLEARSAEYGHPIYLITDEPYRELVYDAETEVPYVTKYYKNTIVCYSYSKSLSLPGERIGYILVPDEIENSADVYAAVCGAGRALGYVCAPSLAQHMVEKCTGLVSDLSIYKENRDLLYNTLTEYGYSCVYPDGAFYLFVKTMEPDANAFCERAKAHDLLLVPADSFGTPGYLRIAYCVQTEMIRRALPAFKALAEEYRK